MNDRIVRLKHSDINWGFDGGQPYVSLDVGKYGSTVIVDPFPCYSHDEKVFQEEVEKCESLVNFQFKPKYFVLPFECISRTNGTAHNNQEWINNTDEKILKPYITFSGKRICIHPAMTRYLVAHELGHILDYHIQHLKNDDFRKEYAELREIDLNTKYGALNWHNNIGEIIANDIRILVFKSELEWWQHNVEYPTKNAKIQEFWKEMINKYFK